MNTENLKEFFSAGCWDRLDDCWVIYDLSLEDNIILAWNEVHE